MAEVPETTQTIITQADLLLTRADGQADTLRLGAFVAPFTMTLDDARADGTGGVVAVLDRGQWCREGARLLEQAVAELRRQALIYDADGTTD